MSSSKDSTSSPALPLLPPRPVDSHKGDYGRALLIGGSAGMAGSISLSGMAALRSGAGLVTIATPQSCAPTVAQFEPSYMTLPLPENEAGQLSVAAKDRLDEVGRTMSCIACGPGLGRSPQLVDLICWMYQLLPQPLVLDADALVALSSRFDRFDEPAGPRILTPHPGEFRRFVDDEELTRKQSEQLAQHLAATRNCVIVLKGHATFITDGTRAVHNTTGNPGMATGGTGDVLTGVITALACQGLDAFSAAHLGVYLHGLAGDMAADEVGQTSLIARDLLRFLPHAFLARERD